MTKYVTVTYDDIKRETDYEYAFLFVFKGKEVFIPRNQVFRHDRAKKTMDIPERVAVKERLI